MKGVTMLHRFILLFIIFMMSLSAYGSPEAAQRAAQQFAASIESPDSPLHEYYEKPIGYAEFMTAEDVRNEGMQQGREITDIRLQDNGCYHITYKDGEVVDNRSPYRLVIIEGGGSPNGVGLGRRGGEHQSEVDPNVLQAHRELLAALEADTGEVGGDIPLVTDQKGQNGGGGSNASSGKRVRTPQEIALQRKHEQFVANITPSLEELRAARIRSINQYLRSLPPEQREQAWLEMQHGNLLLAGWKRLAYLKQQTNDELFQDFSKWRYQSYIDFIKSLPDFKESIYQLAEAIRADGRYLRNEVTGYEDGAQALVCGWPCGE